MKFLTCDNSIAIELFVVRASVTELEVYEACLDYIVQKVPDNMIKRVTAGSARDEVIGMRDSLRYIILKNYSDHNVDLPEKAKNWDIDYLEKESFEK
jgi:hypothetical protein